jgi:hypothetical protein
VQLIGALSNYVGRTRLRCGEPPPIKHATNYQTHASLTTSDENTSASITIDLPFCAVDPGVIQVFQENESALRKTFIKFAGLDSSLGATGKASWGALTEANASLSWAEFKILCTQHNLVPKM